MDNQQSELDLLKERADTLGISYSPKIAVETLRARIEAKLNDKPAPSDNNSDSDGEDQPAGESDTEIRARQERDELRLIRVRIACLNPNKRLLRGEIFSVANRVLGTVRKFIPYGEATDNGYHVPYILLQQLKARKFNQVTIKRLKNGHTDVTSRLVPEFAIEELPPLTKDELEQLARQQAAAAGL